MQHEDEPTDDLDLLDGYLAYDDDDLPQTPEGLDISYVSKRGVIEDEEERNLRNNLIIDESEWSGH